MIRDLQRENRRLRRENEYLKHLSMQYDEVPKEDSSPEQQMLAVAVKRTHTLNAKNYFSYLVQRFRHSRPFLIFDKTRFAMKGFKFAKKMWVFFVGFFAFLGISAQVLLIVGALTVFVPAALIASAVIGVYSYFSHRKRNRILQPLYSEDYDGKIYLVFLPKDHTGGYFVRTASALAEKGHVFLVTPSFRDCGRKSLLRVGDRIFKIHISAYFSFAKRLPPEKTVKVYL
ncbi:MAG: hypothetical protein IJD59_00565 [Clostridia bacterium]|nr:hypothetical protein [Clostridia bacterium]